MSRRTKQLALCGLLAALAVSLMMLGTLIPVATYCCPLLASLVLIVARLECGSMAWGVWAVAASLSVLLAPDKEAAALFVFVGYYPVLKPVFDKIRRKIPRIAIKVLTFNVSLAAMYALLLWVFRLGDLAAEFAAARWMAALLWVGGNATFALYDVLLARLERVYRVRLQKTIRKLF